MNDRSYISAVSTSAASGMASFTLESSSTGSGVVVEIELPPKSRAPRHASKLADAVFGHIQAIRALGRTTVNTLEIATALGVPVADVHNTIADLKSRGVIVA